MIAIGEMLRPCFAARSTMAASGDPNLIRGARPPRRLFPVKESPLASATTAISSTTRTSRALLGEMSSRRLSSAIVPPRPPHSDSGGEPNTHTKR